MDLPKFVNLIQTNSLYLSKMSIFDDKLEGGLTVDDFFIKSNVPRYFDVLMNLVWPTADSNAEKRAEDNKKADLIFGELSQKKFDTPFGRYHCDDTERVFPACREWLYVNCWHKSNHECAAMWEIFGGDKNSLCVFSTVERLETAMTRDKREQNLEIREVKYLNHAKDIFSDDPLDPFISKSESYSFEREIRVISWDPNINLSDTPSNKESGFLLKVDLTKLIMKVVISPTADPWFKSTVEELCKSAGINNKVKDSALKKQPITDIFQAMAHRQEYEQGGR